MNEQGKSLAQSKTVIFAILTAASQMGIFEALGITASVAELVEAISLLIGTGATIWSRKIAKSTITSILGVK